MPVGVLPVHLRGPVLVELVLLRQRALQQLWWATRRASGAVTDTAAWEPGRPGAAAAGSSASPHSRGSAHHMPACAAAPGAVSG